MKRQERPQLTLVPPQTPLQRVGEGVVKPQAPHARGREGIAQPGRQEQTAPNLQINNPSLTPAQKRHLEAYDAWLDQVFAKGDAMRAVQRVREEAAWAQQMAKYGLPPTATFMDLYDLFEAQRKEKAAKGQLPDRTKTAPLIAQKLSVDPAVTLTDKLRTQREREVGRELNEQLTKELQDSRAVEAAQFVRRTIWKDDEQFPRSYGELTSRKAVHVTDNGEMITRSFAGVTLFHRVDNTIDTLFIGIGYVGNETHMPEDTGKNFTQEELDRGVKVYLVERTTGTAQTLSFDTNEKETYTYAFPYADPKALEKFVNYALDEAHDINYFYTSVATRREQAAA